jgi:mitochondrial fission protein ELM1
MRCLKEHGLSDFVSVTQVLTVGALHTVDTKVMRVETARWHDTFCTLPAPIVAVSIGGPTRHCPYGVDLATKLVAGIRTMIEGNGGCVRMTMSRRTPARIARYIRQELGSEARVKIWDGRGELRAFRTHCTRGGWEIL